MIAERTREIELTIVIGARRLHVFLQFPAEAASLSVSGGGSTVIATGIAFSARISPFFARGRRSQVAITGGFPFATALGLFSSKPASAIRSRHCAINDTRRDYIALT
jgi:macrolide transport system ATP-binding/permease protein